MHLVAKQIKGHEYFYLVQKARRGRRVVTTRTIYVGNRRKLAEIIQGQWKQARPLSYSSQEIGASLALAAVAASLGIEGVIDDLCPVRQGAAPIGRRLLLVALHRVLAPRQANGKSNLRAFYEGSALRDLLPLAPESLAPQRLCEMLADLTPAQVEAIETEVVRRLVEHEGITLNALAFDCTNFDSYAAATTPSRLLKRGHAKSGRSLRVLGLGALVTEDDGIPLLTFTYPGNHNDVRAFGRFLRALDRRRSSLDLPGETTLAADGGNISRQMLLRLERDPRYYVLRLPSRHAAGLVPTPRSELRPLGGSLRGKVWARKHVMAVYGVERCVVEVYSRRMHQRQLPGLRRDQKRARGELERLGVLLERQRHGLRRQKPLTVAAVRRRVQKTLAREHMEELFRVRVEQGQGAPVLEVQEPLEAWQHLQDYVLGRTLLVTNRRDWAPEQIVLASRKQSHNEALFRDLKDPEGVSMLPLRHRRDATLRAHALTVVLGLLLVKVLQRRVRTAGVPAPSVASVLGPLKQVQRARVQYGPDAPPALRALAKTDWLPSERTERQRGLLVALGIENRNESGTTVLDEITRTVSGFA